MNRSTNKDSGFSAIELLISIVVAVVLLGGGYQLYTTAMRSSASAKTRFMANNIANEFLRKYESRVNKPCVAITENPPITPDMVQLPGATVQAQITCPNSNTPDINKITIDVGYNDIGAQNVQRSILK